MAIKHTNLLSLLEKHGAEVESSDLVFCVGYQARLRGCRLHWRVSRKGNTIALRGYNQEGHRLWVKRFNHRVFLQHALRQRVPLPTEGYELLLGPDATRELRPTVRVASKVTSRGGHAYLVNKLRTEDPLALSLATEALQGTVPTGLLLDYLQDVCGFLLPS